MISATNPILIAYHLLKTNKKKLKICTPLREKENFFLESKQYVMFEAKQECDSEYDRLDSKGEVKARTGGNGRSTDVCVHEEEANGDAKGWAR